VDAETNDGWTALLLAAFAHELETTKFLLPRANIYRRRTRRRTPLHVASQGGHDNLVKYLLRQGVDVDVETDEGWTSLHLAAESGHMDVVTLLCQEKADLDIKSHDGRRAQDMARNEGHVDVVQYLTWVFYHSDHHFHIASGSRR
jgi:ankyrin repeat protein